jgi:hypothetical protein
MPVPERYLHWPGAAQACRITRLRRTPEGDSIETVYALTSIPRERGGSADYLLDLCRAHWSIENRLHLVRDVSMREDACKVRTGDAPQGLAALRNACVTALRRQGLRTSMGAHYFGENKMRGLALCRKREAFYDIQRDLIRQGILIVAPKALSMEIKPITIAELRVDLENISNCLFELSAISGEGFERAFGKIISKPPKSLA